MAIFPDVNVSPSHFKHAAAGHLFVRTMFYTHQGEGPYAGRPAVFLRLGGCNLGAKGVNAAGCDFCDTDFRLSRSKYVEFGAILEEAFKLIMDVEHPRALGRRRLLVITGGEPMLQSQLTQFTHFARDWDIQIETNGMYFQPVSSWTSLVVSPKLGSAKTYPALREEVLVHAACLKYVVCADDDSPYHTVPREAFEWAHMTGKQLYVSPMAVYRRQMTEQEGERVSAWDPTLIDHVATARNYSYAQVYALQFNLLVSTQQHLFLGAP